MSETSKGYWAASLFAAIIGLSFLFVKISLPLISPVDMLAHRFSVAFLCALAVQFIFRKKIDISFVDIPKVLLVGVLYPSAFFGFQVLGLTTVSASQAGMIQGTIPVFTTLAAIMVLREYPSCGQIISILVSVAGIFCITYFEGIESAAPVSGVTLILLSTLAGSFYNVFVRKLTRHYSVFTLTWLLVATGCLVFNGLAIFLHFKNGSLGTYFRPLMHEEVLISILYLGIFSSFISSFLTAASLARLKASTMSVFNNVAIVVAILAGTLILGDEFRFYHLIGVLLIFLGTLGVARFSK